MHCHFKMNLIYTNILKAIKNNHKLLAILIDPDKTKPRTIPAIISKIHNSNATHIFVGGSEVSESLTETLVIKIKAHTKLPIVLFPGAINQITDYADGLLFLSLLSGRNPDYLIGQQVKAVPKIRASKLEVMPTGYLLIENGKETAVQRVTETRPIPEKQVETIVDTAKAGELLGMKCIYLEAGSGALQAVSSQIISRVKNDIKIPVIVGGGIRSLQDLQQAYTAGADMVVVGTAFETDTTFFETSTI